jgi:hypothetical protein
MSFFKITPSFLLKNFATLFLFLAVFFNANGFHSSSLVIHPRMAIAQAESLVTLDMAQVSQQEAKKGIDKVVNALRKDSKANNELGRLEKVTIVLGYGSPSAGSLAVRFNASFKKSGFGLSAVPLPFGLGQSEKKDGRGQMVGQVKASIDAKTGKITSCTVFRDLGYGRAFNLKV